MMTNLSIIHFLTIILLLTSSSMQISEGLHAGKALTAAAAKRFFVPASNGTEYRKTTEESTEGEPFRVCSDCRCCAQDDPTDCSQMPCCYSIDCDLPDKPYGVCAFVPNSCDCTDCN